jgi:DNA-binding transcriptional ArsR family regulator
MQKNSERVLLSLERMTGLRSELSGRVGACGEFSARELSCVLDLSPSTVYRHLKILCTEGRIGSVKRVGKCWKFYIDVIPF